MFNLKYQLLFSLFVCRLVMGVFAWGPAGANEPSGDREHEGHSAARLIETLEVRSGYEVSLAASEPLVSDPVAIRFDHRGRMWVVEMPDYPTGPRDGAGPAGRIRILTDTDDDGRYDRATTFADGLTFATGVQPYRDGAFVTLAGKIVYFVDTDGDDVADRQEVWFQGFATENEQLRANHPTLGPDGLIYVANGLRGGSVVAADSRFESRTDPIDLRARDFCFDPEGGYWGAVAGNSQFGLTIDDFGRRIGCSNRNPAMLASLDLDAIGRDPLLAPRDAILDVAAAADRSRVVPIADAWTTSNLHAGQFSAACGVLAPGRLNGTGEWLFVCEPTGSLVQRQTLRRAGSVWSAERDTVDSEFLASSDSWFRPVDLAIGPGGALYVVDMSRAVIEHPNWVPEELKNRGDTWDGVGLGRILRVRRSGDSPAFTSITSRRDAIAALQASTPLERQLGSRFLFESGIEGIEDPLRQIVRSTHGNVAARARAASLLRRFDALGDETWRGMLDDPEARVRAVAVSIADREPESATAIAEIATDADRLVRRHVAAYLTSLPSDAIDVSVAVDALAAIAGQDADDLWTRRGIGSVDEGWLRPLLDQYFAVTASESEEAREESNGSELASHLVRRLARRSASEAAEVLRTRLQHLSGVSGGGGAGDGIDEAAERPGLGEARLVLAWSRGVRDGKSSVAAALDGLADQTRAVLSSAIDGVVASATDPRVDVLTRRVGIDVAGLSGRVPETYRAILGPTQSPELRVAVVPALFRRDLDWTLGYLQDRLASMPHPLRRAVVAASLSSNESTEWLLSRIESDEVAKSILDPATANRLRKHRDEAIAKRAQSLLAPDADRQKVLATYASATRVNGNAMAGKKLFSEHCSACHQIDSTGTNVGPDISDSRTKTPEALLVAILDPNAAIDAAYVRYSLLTDDGRVLEGLMVDETADSVTLAQQGGERVTVRRDQIEEMQSPGVSLMPNGFESQMNVEQMGDLITYLKNWRYLDRDIPLSPAESADAGSE